MRLIPSDPDIQTLVARIEGGDIELQPNFQRGEVWPKGKKQKLIDSVLRDWHIPPIHVIENMTTQRQEVLDGQQRLAAIRDFVRGDFAIDGGIEPPDDGIEKLDGFRYQDLNETWRRRFNQFAIRVFRLVEYEPGEPWELFFRLNQTTKLTGAEERNAFFGPVRDQIKGLVRSLSLKNIDERVLGFTNARMAYDDILSRTALAIDRRTLAEKITANDLTALYRSPEPLAHDIMKRLESATEKLAAFEKFPPKLLRLNKASVFTWLMFVVRAEWDRPFLLDDLAFVRFLDFFAYARNEVSHGAAEEWNRSSAWLSYIYEDRSSARVADTSSVILRDAIVWNFYRHFAMSENRPLPLSEKRGYLLMEAFENLGSFDEDELSQRLTHSRWGDLP